ncbi:MAG: hypothetical protein COA85_03055 [Robiginitomaculum sp.]|nr:MAG: hypothetical protein COA85_03055 [Robiginitomaculum sp.]
MKTLLLVSALVLLLSACGNDNNQQVGTGMGLDDPFVSDVIGVEPKHLSADFWIKRKMDKVLLSPEKITAFNARNTAQDPTLYNLASMADALGRDDMIIRMRTVSRISKSPRIYEDGTPVTAADFERYEAMLNLGAITDQNAVRFALAVRRTSMRSYPTQDLIFSEGAQDRDIERFQESALFPGDAVAVLHTSADGQWALVQSYNYIAWVPKTAIAMGARDEVLGYASDNNFLVVTGDKVFTVFNPDVPQVSEVQLDMGVRLALSRPKALANNLYGQNPYLSHMVLMPVRKSDGTLALKHALIQRKADVHVGYLPFTRENIIRQSFKFLGERYGWGHRFNGRDCTGFVSEVYKSFGIKLPRNSGDQGRSAIGINSRYAKVAPLQDKIDRLKRGKVGDLIYIPGHVLMLIGHDQGQPYVIHDVHGLGYLQDDGTLYKGTLNEVSITPMLPLRSNAERSYLQSATTIKTLP